MDGNDLQKPESIEILYNRKDLEEIIELFLNKPKYAEEKSKVLAYVNRIEKKIAKIKQYQGISNPNILYPDMNVLLLEIRDTANAIFDLTKHCDLSLPNRLRQLILDWINPLEEALKRQKIPGKIAFKTKSLYAQQSFVSRQEDLRKELMRHLEEVKVFLSKPNKPDPRCYIIYACSSDKRKEEEYWVQPFLYILYDHLTAVGIRVIMDIRDNEPGDSIFNFMDQHHDSNYIILIGTESLLEKHRAGKDYVVQTELNIIIDRFNQDQEQFGQSRIYPMLISGTINTSYPEIYDKYRTVRDARENGYLGTLKELTDWIYAFRLKRLKKDDEYADLWRTYFKSISNLPSDRSAVKEEISKNYHRSQHIEELKQNNVLPELTPVFDNPSESPRNADECRESNDSSISEPASADEFSKAAQNTFLESYNDEGSKKAGSNERLTDDEFNKVPEFKSEIINVSGFHHCCGLFALALAVKITMREQGVNKSDQLDFLNAIDEEALKSTTVHTENIAKQLKEEMYWALLFNEAYKERRLHSFTDYCRAKLEGGFLAEDMSSFAEANKFYIEELKALWLSIKEAVEKQFEGVEAAYREYLGTKLTPSLIDEFKEKLSGLVISSPDEEKVKQFIDSYCEGEADLMGELIKFNRLYRSVWPEFEAGTSEQRNRLDELYTKILTKKSIVLLEKEQDEEFIKALLKLSFLQKTSFECNGELEKIRDKKEIISTVIFLLVRTRIKKEWNVIYENYCKHVKESSTMLSADELGCLALRWKVQLRIQFGSGESYETHQEDELTLIHVTLCNPSHNHWQVYRESRKKPIKEFDSTSLDKVRAKLNFDELLISNEGPGIPSLNCEEEVAELATLPGKEETEVNQISRKASPMMAAQNGHKAVIAQLLDNGVDVNQSDAHGLMSLMMAAYSGDQGVIARLLAEGADVNQAQKDGATPLTIAAQNGHQGVVLQLLEKGANVNQADEQGWTPLMIAAQKGHQAVVLQLLDKGADVNQVGENGVTLLYMAAENGHQAVVKQLLERGVDVNQSDKDGWTSLMIAAQNGHEEVVAQLLEKGANVNQAEKDGWTPLMIAARNGHQTMVVQLLDNGADVNQASKDGKASLYIAAQNGYEDVVAQLLKKGADVNQTGWLGMTPLYIAAQNGYEDVVAQLLKKGADVNQTGWLGMTPLYIATQKGHQGVVVLLLEKGANVNQADEYGSFPLMIAAREGHESVVAQLLEKGANVNQADKIGRTPFMVAVEIKGVYGTNKYGEFSINIGIQPSQLKIAACLLKAGAKIKMEQKALLYPYLQKWLKFGEYKACLMLSDYRLRQEPEVRIEERVTAYYAQGKLDEACTYLDMLAKKGRKKDKAFIAHKNGYIRMERGEFDSAIKDYEAALQEDKDNNRVRYDRMLAELYKAGNPEAVLKALEELPNPETFKDNQEMVYCYHVKGFIYHQCSQHKKALACFNAGLKRDEKDIFTLAKRGFLLLCQGKREEGFRDLDAALGINPYYSGALARKGYGLAFEECFEEHFDEAMKYFKRSLQVNPTHFETLLLQGASFILQERLSEAKECIEKTFAVSISRSFLIAQHMPQKVKEKIIDYAFDFSFKDKEKKKLKDVLSVLLRLSLFSEKTQEKVEFYLMNAYSEEELNILLREISKSSPLYKMVYRIVLDNAKKHRIERKQREIFFAAKQQELQDQLMQLTDENPLATQKENIQKEIEQLIKTQEPVDDLRNLLIQCVEPSELSGKYSTLSLIQRWSAPKEKYLIAELEERVQALERRVQAIDKFIEKHPSISYQSVRDSLEIIREIYDEYQKNLKDFFNNKELRGEEREKRLNDLYTPRCRLSMALFRDRYLKKEVQSLLAPHEGEIEEKKGENVYGTHVVKQYGEVHFKYHDKTNPCYPVIECMIGTLYSLLAGMSYGTAPTEIVKLHYKGYDRVLVASQTLKGINLLDFLMHYVERESQLIHQFDSHSFSTMIITSLLSNPVDGKPDNYMVQFFRDEKNEEKIKVLGFDNDLAFGEPVVKIHRGKRVGQHFVEVRNVFYFFPQMNAPIDPALCKRLVEESPELLMLEFIRSLQKQDAYYKQLLKERVLTAKEGGALQLAICFSREETLGIMYKRLRAIQRCLKENSQLSHMQLFYAIYPEMASYYQEVASKNQAEPDAILRNIAELYAASACTLEEAKIILERESLVTMSRVAIKTMEKGKYAKPLYPLLKGIEKFVESIQFSGISVERQRQILEKIKLLKGVEQVTIRNCEGLDDKLLQTLVEDLSTLRRLDLIGCSQITSAGVAAAHMKQKKVVINIKDEPIKKEESKKQELTPQFNQFLEQSSKSEKEAEKESQTYLKPKGL